MPHRFLLQTFGYLSLVLGFIGIFLPLLPTTPFILLAAYCFSRSSPRMHAWIMAQPTLGPMVRDWQEHGIIRPRAKWLSTIMMVLLMSYPILFGPIPFWIKITLTTISGGVLVFIWSRPSRLSQPRGN